MAERAVDDPVFRKARADDGQLANAIDQTQMRHDIFTELDVGRTWFDVLARNQRE